MTLPAPPVAVRHASALIARDAAAGERSLRLHAPRAAKVGERSAVTLAEARSLLDALEGQGCTRLEVDCPDGMTFVLRWQWPARD